MPLLGSSPSFPRFSLIGIQSALLIGLTSLLPAETPAEALGQVEIRNLFHDFYGTEDTSSIRFSWKLKAEGRAQLQNGYQISVANTEADLKSQENLIWDSGEVASGQSLYINYAGPALTEGQNYFWSARLKKADGEWGSWGATKALTFSKQAPIKTATESAQIGYFESNNKSLNTLFHHSLELQKQCLGDSPQFEPEGKPWGGPFQLTTRGFALQSDLKDKYRSWTTATLDSLEEKSPFPSLVGADNANETEPSSGFSEAMTVTPFTLWQLTGDLSLAKPSFLPAVEHVIAMQQNDPNYEGKAFGKHRGDWGHLDDATSAEFLSLCHLALNCRLLGEVATATGHLPYTIQHQEWYRRIQKAFPEHFLDEEGNLKEKSQTALILALRLGLLPPELKQAKADELALRIEKEGLKAGMFGQNAVLPVLSWTGHHEQAVKIAQDFAKMAAEGKSVTVAAASASEWMMSFLAGFIHQTPGFKTLRITPMIPTDGSITEVKARYETGYGQLAIHWKKTENELTAEVTIPPNTTGIISLPASESATVTEGGKSLEDALACQFMRDQNGRKEIIAQSGTYSFVVTEKSGS